MVIELRLGWVPQNEISVFSEVAQEFVKFFFLIFTHSHDDVPAIEVCVISIKGALMFLSTLTIFNGKGLAKLGDKLAKTLTRNDQFQ